MASQPATKAYLQWLPTDPARKRKNNVCARVASQPAAKAYLQRWPADRESIYNPNTGNSGFIVQPSLKYGKAVMRSSVTMSRSLFINPWVKLCGAENLNLQALCCEHGFHTLHAKLLPKVGPNTTCIPNPIKINSLGELAVRKVLCCKPKTKRFAFFWGGVPTDRFAADGWVAMVPCGPRRQATLSATGSQM